MSAGPKIKLTSLASCAGCASKLNQAALRKILPNFSRTKDKRVLVDSETGDDAGVFQIDRENALVQTVDFFMPIVDDPYAYGQIAATNAISDVFAMGGRPLTALNIVGFPADRVPPSVVSAILRGGAKKAAETGCAVIGGHTIRNPEPIYGLAVTGMVKRSHLITNARARPNDILILTKPLGTGIVTTAIKRGVCPASLARKAIALMTKLNSAGAALAEAGLVNAATDVTGFGLMGHLASMCRASTVSALIDPAAVPAIGDEIFRLIEGGCIPGGTKDNLKLTGVTVDWGLTKPTLRVLLCDAQTSGGLLLSVAEKNFARVLETLKADRSICGQVIGRMTRPRDRFICMKA
ncbi:MAG TPA: selenide, water dikinase SelD [Chthoniobacterales bacterium]|jgi:selenide,water dikinase